MSGPQFMHMETYQMSVSKLRKKREATCAEEGRIVDRKLTVEEICGEAARLPEQAPHVEAVQPPTILYGVSPEEIPAVLTKKIAAANARIRKIKADMPRGERRAGPRAVRQDTHTLVTMVASHPIPWVDEATGSRNFDDQDNAALLQKWLQANIAWALAQSEKLGFELLSVVLHTDETYPHLHFLGVPQNDRVEARKCHPGYQAMAALDDQVEGATKKSRNKAYIEAMRTFQDSYFEAVSLDAGLLRTGPKRRRLSRAAYQADKAEGRARGLASVHHETLKIENNIKKTELGKARELLEQVESDTHDAIMQEVSTQARLNSLEIKFKERQKQLSSDEYVISQNAGILEDIEKAKAELEEILRNRDIETRKLAEQKKTIDEQFYNLNLARSEFDSRKKSLEEERTEFYNIRSSFNTEMANERESLARDKDELESLVLGVEAYVDGHLIYDPEDDLKFAFVDQSRPELLTRLKAVKPTLQPILQRLHEATERRVIAFTNAISETIEGWSTGLLRGLKETRADGQPTFDISDSPKGDRLASIIEPFRSWVAIVVSKLPNLQILAGISKRAERLADRLDNAELQAAHELDCALNHIRSKRGIERE